MLLRRCVCVCVTWTLCVCACVCVWTQEAGVGDVSRSVGRQEQGVVAVAGGGVEVLRCVIGQTRGERERRDVGQGAVWLADVMAWGDLTRCRAEHARE